LALPGTTAGGMAAPCINHERPEPAGWTVAIPVSGRAPAGGIALSQMPGCWSSPFMPPGLSLARPAERERRRVP